ncbi:MAG: Arm DNA-binding domain-containing protein [Gammaproteobacteria bacterium]
MEIWRIKGAPERITDDWLQNLCGQRSRATREVLDKKGLFVRISVLGRIQFVARYQLERRPHELTLGAFPDMGIEQARSEREAMQEEIRQGKDPKLTRSFLDRYQREVRTVEDLVWELLDHYPQNYFLSEPDTLASFEKFVFPALGKRQPGQVTKQEWLAVLADAYRTDANVARLLMSELARAFSLAVKLGVIRQPVLPARYRELRDKLYTYLEDHCGIPMSW